MMLVEGSDSGMMLVEGSDSGMMLVEGLLPRRQNAKIGSVLLPRWCP